MARNNRAKKPKKKTTTREQLDTLLKRLSKELGQKVICITQQEIEEIKKEALKASLQCSKSLLEYNMILDNHLTPQQAEHQSNLMDIRAQAILDGDLTWEEVDAFLDEYHAKEEADG